MPFSLCEFNRLLNLISHTLPFRCTISRQRLIWSSESNKFNRLTAYPGERFGHQIFRITNLMQCSISGVFEMTGLDQKERAGFRCPKNSGETKRSLKAGLALSSPRFFLIDGKPLNIFPNYHLWVLARLRTG